MHPVKISELPIILSVCLDVQSVCTSTSIQSEKELKEKCIEWEFYVVTYYFVTIIITYHTIGNYLLNYTPL